MRVDQVLDWVGADGCKCGCDLRTRACKTRVDEQLPVSTRKDGHISTSTHEDAYVAAQPFDGDRGICCAFPSRLHKAGRRDDFCPCENRVWSEKSYSASQASGCEKLAARHAVTDLVGHGNLPRALVSCLALVTPRQTVLQTNLPSLYELRLR